MTQDTENKVERLRNIFKEIDDLYAQAAVIIEGGSDEVSHLETSEPVQVAKRKYTKHKKEILKSGKTRKTATCSLCGKLGHKSHYCPTHKAEHREIIKKRKNLDDIEPVEVTQDAEAQAVENGALNRMQFTMARDRKHKEMTTNDTAEAMDVDENEVRLVYQSITYPGYLRLR